MEWENYFKSIFKGLIFALMATFLVTAILSLVMNNMTLPDGLFNIIYVVISCLALLIGTIVAVKTYGSKGWIIGLSVGCIFYISLYLIGILFGAEATLTGYDFIKFVLCILIGAFSGMLGVNL
ncbi:MAG: TIGR04086 family membrane protein [Clostridiales bacterium]|nr:TIGR04086 family membrane protein [Clostridiales bacterium]